MATSAIGNRRFAPDAGVTLVEALTALAIIALVAGMALLAMPGPDRAVRGAAEQMAARLALAADDSIIRNRPVALIVTHEGYGFARLEDSGWARIEAASPLSFRAWPDGVTHRIIETEADAPAREAGRVARFDATGGATPAQFVLSGAGARFTLSIDAQGRTHVARES
ncbi:MAG: GspH/FimT family pseudopilin [Hyphomonadaceae bacterium]